MEGEVTLYPITNYFIIHFLYIIHFIHLFLSAEVTNGREEILRTKSVLFLREHKQEC